jgi:hypothetical protein
MLCGFRLIIGTVLTVILIVAVSKQPAEEVPITVYVVEALGETEIDAPVWLPGDQAYVVAPLAVNNVDSPLHIIGSLVLAKTLGSVLTVTVIMLVLTQPALLVPVTVYVVVAVGDTVIEDPDKLPGNHA